MSIYRERWHQKDDGSFDAESRLTAMTCADCDAFCPYDEDSKRVGSCRRHAPTEDGWPQVSASDWCLEFYDEDDAVKALK